MIIKLIVILFVLMLIIGQERGWISFIALFINGIIMIALVYGIARGINPYVVSFAASTLITYITLVYQNGKNVKSISSVISVIFVMAVLTFVIQWIVNNSHIGGYSEVVISDESMYFSTEVGLSMNAVMVCVVLIGLLGAVIDTSITITTAVYEVHRTNNNLGIKELAQSGRNFGEDILGTMANTLLFAGMGEVLMLFIWISRMNNYSFSQFLNSKAFLQEMIVIIVSNIGCVIVIPVSVLVICYMLKRTENE
ncbi:MAG: YibE/F family protein [Lachnotalea sp.]